MEALPSTLSKDILPLLTELSAEFFTQPIEVSIHTCKRSDSAINASIKQSLRPAKMKIRKRSADRSKQTRQLEGQVKERRQQVSVLLQDNLFLRTRHAMLQQVIAWKDQQVASLTSIHNNCLEIDPFLQLGTSVTVFPALCTPQWYASHCIARSGDNLAMLLASVAPLLASCPQLLSPTCWQRQHMAASCLVQPNTLPFDVTEHQPLLALVQEVDKLRVSTTHAYLTVPAMMLSAGAHISLLNGTYDTWEAVGSAVSRCTDSLQACSSDTPSVAPEYHWRRVITSCKLDNQQRLQAFVLWDILTAARRAVTTQRIALLKALTSMQQAHISHSMGQTIPASVHAAVWKDPEQLCQEAQILEQLHEVLTKERCLFLLVGEVFMWTVLSPVQAAMLTVGCHPYMPDFTVSLRASFWAGLAALLLFGTFLQALIHAAALDCTPDVMRQLVHKEEQLLWGTGQT